MQESKNLTLENPEEEMFSDIVIKIGGSCLTDGRTIKNAIDKIYHIINQKIIPIIVVSALRGMTDSLFEVAVTSHKEYDPKIIDKILSEGEQLSAKIMKSALGSVGIKARAILPSEASFPIITNEQHGNAKILFEETEQRIKDILTPLIKEGIIPIIPGFVGKTKEGAITTLGRGGSDTTAILLGKALEAKEVILLKDVEGILSGDPKIINSPKKVSHITAKELVYLGARGGKVLCPRALLYKPKDIKIRIVDFESCDILKGGTEIVGELEENVRVEIIEEKKSAVTIIGKEITNIPELIGKVSEIFLKEGILYSSVFTSDSSLCFYIDADQQHKALKSLHDIVMEDEKLTAVTSLPDVTSIKITSRSGATCVDNIGKICTILVKENIPIIDLSVSMSEGNIFVYNSDTEKTKYIVEGLL